MKLIRIPALFFAALLLIATPTLADCEYYECRYGIDTAFCSLRFGPNAHLFRWGTDCEVVANCMWSYSETWGWSYSCSYFCDVKDCYLV